MTSVTVMTANYLCWLKGSKLIDLGYIGRFDVNWHQNICNSIFSL